MKYYIIDLSITYEDGLPEDGWFIDGEGNIVHKCETFHEFMESFRYNIEVAKEYDKIDETKLWCELIENGYTEVNGFGYSIKK